MEQLLKNMENKSKFILFGILVLILAVVVLLGSFYYFNKQKSSIELSPLIVKTTQENLKSEEGANINKIDFGNKIPLDFPQNIPLELGAKIEQSYGLDYQSQKQLTIVFLSDKTVKQNYGIYADFLKKEKWNVVNDFQSEKLSTLYASKEKQDINITIFFDEAVKKAKVSISVLNK